MLADSHGNLARALGVELDSEKMLGTKRLKRQAVVQSLLDAFFCARGYSPCLMQFFVLVVSLSNGVDMLAGSLL